MWCASPDSLSSQPPLLGRATVHARLGADAHRPAAPGHGCLSSDVPLRGLRAAGASAHLLPLLPEARGRPQPLTGAAGTTLSLGTTL